MGGADVAADVAKFWIIFQSDLVSYSNATAPEIITDVILLSIFQNSLTVPL